MFILGAKGMDKTYFWLKAKSKILAISFMIVVVAVLLYGAYLNINMAHQNIYSKKDSYSEVKDAALWIKQNSLEKDIILSMSRPQTIYYAERTTYQMAENVTDFEKQIDNASFLIISVFEKHEPWIYSYPKEHRDRLIPVQSYTQGGNVVLVIYKIQNET